MAALGVVVQVCAGGWGSGCRAGADMQVLAATPKYSNGDIQEQQQQQQQQQQNNRLSYSLIPSKIDY